MPIEVRDVSRRFGRRTAVDRVSFDVPTGGICGLIGPNGSGKTTILRMLATFLTPTAGSIRVSGFDTQTNPIAVRRAVGYLPEALPGYPEARIDEYLDYRARLKGIARTARTREIDRSLDLCRLTSVRRRIIGRLSQGYRRRVGLADALSASPPVLLLDEPTIGLDPLQVKQTRDVLKELSDRSTVLLSTHLLAEAQAVCGRILMLAEGRLVSDLPLNSAQEGNTFEIEIRASAAECAVHFAAFPGVRSVTPTQEREGRVVLQIEGTGDDVRERVVRECVARGWGVNALRDRHDDLESHFVRVVLSSRREAA